MRFGYLALIVFVMSISGCSHEGYLEGKSAVIKNHNKALEEMEKTYSAVSLIYRTLELFPDAQGLPKESDVKDKKFTLPRVIDIPDPEVGAPPGRASVALLINERGEVIKSKVVSSSSGEVAIYSKSLAQKMVFLPATIDGEKIKVALVAPVIVTPPF